MSNLDTLVDAMVKEMPEWSKELKGYKYRFGRIRFKGWHWSHNTIECYAFWVWWPPEGQPVEKVWCVSVAKRPAVTELYLGAIIDTNYLQRFLEENEVIDRSLVEQCLRDSLALLVKTVAEQCPEVVEMAAQAAAAIPEISDVKEAECSPES